MNEGGPMSSKIGGSGDNPFIQPTSGDKTKQIPNEKKVPSKEVNLFKEANKKVELGPNKVFKGTISTGLSKAKEFCGKLLCL